MNSCWKPVLFLVLSMIILVTVVQAGIVDSQGRLSIASKLNADGDIQYENANYAAACDLYNQSLSINSDNSTVWNNYGLSLFKLYQYKDALIAFNKSTTINPDDASAWYYMGMLLDYFDRSHEALDAYNWKGSAYGVPFHLDDSGSAYRYPQMAT